jgi:GWxTD domain-containing protein
MKSLTLIIVLAFLTLPAFSYDVRDASAPSRFRINVDVAKFRGDSAKLYLEVYYAFDVSQLNFVRTGNTLESEVVMDVFFKRSSSDSIVARQAWRIPFSTSDSSILLTSRYYVDVIGFLMKPDVYRLYVVGRDRSDAARSDSLSFALALQPVESKQIALSDLELCTSINSMEKDSVNKFVKNTYEVKPNPSRIFGSTQPVIFYYVESYNLLKNKSANYYTKIEVANSVGKEVITHERIKRRVNESNVEVGTVKVNTLRTGAYTLRFSAVDSVDNTSYTSSKKFFVYNPTLPMDSLTTGTEGSVLASEYATMSEAELDREFEFVRYIATRDELAQYKNIKGVEAKRKSLFEFWNKRDDDPTTPGNTVKTEYLKRIDYCIQHFKAGFREGWKTDRGRVFIVYGPPDEIERHANEVDVKPYEVWLYNSIQGGVQFIFGDRSGFADYVLLHSTHREELHDENWMRQIQVQQ